MQRVATCDPIRGDQGRSRHNARVLFDGSPTGRRYFISKHFIAFRPSCTGLHEAAGDAALTCSMQRERKCGRLAVGGGRGGAPTFACVIACAWRGFGARSEVPPPRPPPKKKREKETGIRSICIEVLTKKNPDSANYRPTVLITHHT